MKSLASIALITPIMLVSIIVGLQSVKTATANPYSYIEWSSSPSGPNLNPPTITVLSPVEGQIFNSTRVVLMFNINKPESWFISGKAFGSPISGTKGYINWLSITFDGSPRKNISANDYQPIIGNNIPRSLTFAAVLDGLSNGTHCIEISAGGKYDYTEYSSFNYTEFEGRILVDYDVQWKSSLTVSEVRKVNFTVVTNEPFRFTKIDVVPTSVSRLITTNIAPENKTYTSSNLPLNFSLSKTVLELYYSLDNQTNTAITGNTTLTGLGEGPHSIILRATDYAGETFVSERTYFAVDTTAPKVEILSPENKTYNTKSIPIIFALTENATLEVSLDGLTNITIGENSTIEGLYDGSHSIVFYANDTVGNGASQAVNFTIQSQIMQPFKTIWVPVIPFSVTLGGGILLIYHKKHQKRTVNV